MCTFGILGLSCEASAAPVHDAVFFVPSAVSLLPECLVFLSRLRIMIFRLYFFSPVVFFRVPLPYRHLLAHTRDPTHVPRDSGVKSCRATSLSPLSCSQIFLVLTATTAAPQGAGAAKLHATSWPRSPGTRPHYIHTCTSDIVSFPTPGDQLRTLQAEDAQTTPTTIAEGHLHAPCSGQLHLPPTATQRSFPWPHWLIWAQWFTREPQFRQLLHVKRPTFHRRSNAPLTRSLAVECSRRTCWFLSALM